MPDFRTILVPLDGSSFAENALPAATAIAHRHKAKIQLVRVHSQYPVWEVGAEIVAISPEVEQRVFDAEQAYLGRVAERLRSAGIAVSVAVLTGEIVPAIRQYAAARSTDLVVMTSHGWGGVRRAVLGSVADYLMRTMDTPVLVVTAGMTLRIGPSWPHRILVPLDGSPLAASALDQTRTLVGRSEVNVYLTSVVQTIPPDVTPWVFPPELFVETVERREEEARRDLEATKTRLQENGVQVETRIRVGSKVAREILKVAEVERCDLIAIATHGAGGLDRIMFGSVTDQVVRHSHIPILVVRPSARVKSPQPAIESSEIASAGVS